MEEKRQVNSTRRVLWVMNIAIPEMARKLGLEVSNKEGWLSGLFDVVMNQREQLGIERVALCFPSEEKICHEVSKHLVLYSFPEDLKEPESERPDLIPCFSEIFEEFQPNLIHVFGTEYFHAAAAAKAAYEKYPVLVSMAGVMSECAKQYLCGISEKRSRKRTLRDYLKHDSMAEQKDKFLKRSLFEQNTLQLISYVAGRTHFDQEETRMINHDLTYFHLDEVLRNDFYHMESSEKWKPDQCCRYSIFLSQGNYPLKGAHLVIEALAIIRNEYPGASLRIAGDDITRSGSLSNRIKISGYGKLLRDTIRKYHLEDAVSFTGMLDAEGMKKEYRSANVFVCASSVENSPNSIAEAMLIQTPVVTSNAGGITDVIEKNTECLMFESGDVKAMAEAIIEVFRSPKNAASRSEQALQHALNSHNKERIIKQLKDIYDTCMEEF